MNELQIKRAREARAAIERLYIEMRHLFNRGRYRQLGEAGEVLTDALLTVSPEIYGAMSDPYKVELDGLVYVLDRLPKGIEETRLIKLISSEGYEDSGFEVIMPAKRRRNCYRIDQEQMFIEVTRGRSEIYDILTHLTFMYIEARKIREHVQIRDAKTIVEWKKLGAMVEEGVRELPLEEEELALTYLSNILGRTFEETRHAYRRLEQNKSTNNGLFHAIYWMGKLAMEDELEGKERVISFSPTLRERIGQHLYGERWANAIKQYLHQKKLFDRPLHIISANMHSVMNSLYAYPALTKTLGKALDVEALANELSLAEHGALRKKVRKYALTHGMHEQQDPFGTNISVQIFDTARLNPKLLAPDLEVDSAFIQEEKPLILVMDYAFGEQAYETMDELLRPYTVGDEIFPMNVKSINIMGKAGILEGGKGDIMIPDAHVFEGTADNYPFKNDFCCNDFEGEGVFVCSGPMITVLGTSLQNRDLLAYFKYSSWSGIGLEMEGAHYQKAIQAAYAIRKHIESEIALRYAYYASDNPLITGGTLASGSLGSVGVKPTYLITKKILGRILNPIHSTGELSPAPALV